MIDPNYLVPVGPLDRRTAAVLSSLIREVARLSNLKVDAPLNMIDSGSGQYITLDQNFVAQDTTVFPTPVSTTLAAAITTVFAQTIQVTSADGFPDQDEFKIQIDAEIMQVIVGVQGTNQATTWTVTRGVDGTAPATHSNGATVTWPPSPSESNPQTLLNGALGSGAGATTVTVDSAAGFPIADQYKILIDQEVMLVVAGHGTTSWTVVRGLNTASPPSHADDSPVYLAIGNQVQQVTVLVVDGQFLLPGPEGQCTLLCPVALIEPATSPSDDGTLKDYNFVEYDETNDTFERGGPCWQRDPNG